MAYSYSFVSQTCDGKAAGMTLNQGESKEVEIVIKNTGTTTWTKGGANPVRLGTSHSQDRASAFYDSGTWLNDHRIEMQESSVPQNSNATFRFNMKNTRYGDLAGDYSEYFQPVVEGTQWMTDIGIFAKVTCPARIASFLFLWYGPSGYGWNSSDTPGDVTAKHVDVPVAGLYDSADDDTIRRQFDDFVEAGIDYVIMDLWWDNNTGGSYETVTKANFANAIGIMESEYPSLRFAPLIEPQPNVSTNHAVPTACYDWLYTNYGSNSCWENHQGKKLVYTFCKRQGAADSRFNTLSMCNGGASGYSFDFWGDPAVVRNNYLSIMHRFDNRQLTGIPNVNILYANPTLGESIWEQQMQVAMANRGNIKRLHISPYNEYRERQNWEPHSNPDSNVDDDFMMQTVKNFTYRWRQ